jgi:hypothetical protein
MATVLEAYSIEKQLSVFEFLWTKGPIVKHTHKEMFPVYWG